MCRSIKVLRTPDVQPPDTEIREAALQFIRKISGYRHPSQANMDAFQQAVDDVGVASRVLLSSLKQRQQAGARQP